MIDPVMEKKLDALALIDSQFYEGGANGSADAAAQRSRTSSRQRRQQVRDGFTRRQQSLADRFRAELGEWYGPDQAAADQICRGLRDVRIRPPAE